MPRSQQFSGHVALFAQRRRQPLCNQDRANDQKADCTGATAGTERLEEPKEPGDGRDDSGDRKRFGRDWPHQLDMSIKTAKELSVHVWKAGISVLAVLTLTTFLSCSRASQHEHVNAPGAAYDEAFLKWFVNYHAENDRMVDPCSKHDSIREELRNFCIETDRQHVERLDRMRGWLKNWYGQELPKPDSYPLWLGTLKGQEFEKEFLKSYVRDHAEGIEETARCASRAVHPELRELCTRINPSQKKTAEKLKQWQCEWFKECGA